MDNHDDRGGGGGGGGDYYSDPNRNSHSATSSWSSDDPVPHHERNFDNGFHSNAHHHQHHHRHHQNDSIGVSGGRESGSAGHSFPPPGRKRLFSPGMHYFFLSHLFLIYTFMLICLSYQSFCSCNCSCALFIYSGNPCRIFFLDRKKMTEE